MRLSLVPVVALVLATTGAPRALPDETGDPLPSSRLAVHGGEGWVEWWRSGAPPARWTGRHPALDRALKWRHASDGIEWAEVQLSGRGQAWRTKLVVARIDPARVTFALDTAFTAGRERAAWSINRAGDDVLLAVNAGQFPRALPWGWVTIDGVEFLAPGTGPLSTGVAFSGDGIRWIAGDSIHDSRQRRGAQAGFQSYPTLLSDDGRVPPALRASGLGIDTDHRDARLAIGQDREGYVLIAMTRFDALGGALDFVPFGLTSPEMAAVMGALGARDAVMLDGGISAQLMIRDGTRRLTWEGMRKVPLGLVVKARD